MDQPYPAGDPLGRVYTMPSFAWSVMLAALASRVAADVAAPEVVLDPSVGAGGLLDAARKMWPTAQHYGVDIDPGAAGLARCDRHEVADWRAVARFYDALFPKRPDLIVQNPPFGKEIGVQVTIEHVLWSIRLARHAMVILPLPYLCGAQFDTVWIERRPATIYRVKERPWPDRLREVAVFEWNDWHVGPTQILDLDWSGLPSGLQPG